MMMKTCPKCESVLYTENKFCGICGTLLIQKFKQWIGEDDTKGIYRLTIILEREFRSEDVAREAAKSSYYYNEDGKFDSYKLELVKLTTTPETHPYVCASCPKKGYKPLVTQTTDGICICCGKSTWESRSK